MSPLNHTRKLYWADARRIQFTARVLAYLEADRPAIVLNRTLFYPTSGGQPHDTGALGGERVVDVQQQDGQILHYVNNLPPPSGELAGAIDWQRRWDHMQQHSGQHLLSAGFLSLFDRPTIGFHLSADTVTIDLPGSMPDHSEIDDVLSFCARVIAEDRPISAYEVAPADLASIPLRKAPAVNGPVRVVEIAGTDWSACGGTHTPTTAGIGSVAITRVERRGDSVRVYFACGERAATDHRRRLAVTQTLSEQLTTGLDDLAPSVERLRADLNQTQRNLRQMEAQLAEAEAVRLWTTAPLLGAVKLVRHILPDGDANALRRLQSSLLAQGGCVTLLAASGNESRWSAGRATGIDLDLRTYLPALRSLPGVQGGGSADLIQGSSADAGRLHSLLDTLEAAITESIDARTGS